MSDEKASSSKDRKKIEQESKDDTTMETIRKFFADKLSLVTPFDGEKVGSEKVIADLSFDGLTKHWKDKGFKNIITMVGAGISTSAGIPDFRSPGSGLYDNLQKYDLPTPTAIFDIDYFMNHPEAFFDLARELYPGTFNPTPSHYFVRLLHEKGLLLRHYTQNIDTLERVAGIPEEKLVEAHGTFYSNHCLGCRKIYSMQWMKEEIFSHREPKCIKCNFLVKPDIVFFGENLPEKFYKLPTSDFEKCDLLIIMGTSLEVQPFASLIDHAGSRCVRLLINRTKVGNDYGAFSSFMSGPGLMFDSSRNTRDVAYIGDCDDGVLALAEALGWSKELSELLKNDHERLDKERAAGDSNKKDENSAQTGAKDINQKADYSKSAKETPLKKDDAKL